MTVYASDELERFEGEERVERVITRGGLELAADAVVIGAGVTPDVQLAQRAGLEIGERGGVRCDAQLQSSVPGVFAAGDICEYESLVNGGARIRVEHWDVAFNQGKTAALNMLGQGVAHEVVPYFYSVFATGANSSMSGRRTSGTRRSCAAPTTRAISRTGICRTAP